MNERLGDRNRIEQEALRATIAERLGHIGIEGYHDLPRKTKKAAKKQVEGRPLTQLELSRLARINGASNEND